MKIILKSWQIRILKLITLGCSVLPTLWVLGDIKRNFASGSAIGIVSDGFLLLVALYVFGMTFSLLYTGGMAAGIVDSLLYPRRCLKAPPVITTRQKGLIARKEYLLAETELCEMRLAHPDSADVALMLAELHASVFGSPETAVSDIAYYIRHRKLRYNNLHLTMAMRCADFMMKFTTADQAAEFLQKESRTLLVYTARERNVMRLRAESLTNEF